MLLISLHSRGLLAAGWSQDSEEGESIMLSVPERGVRTAEDAT